MPALRAFRSETNEYEDDCGFYLFLAEEMSAMEALLRLSCIDLDRLAIIQICCYSYMTCFLQVSGRYLL
jgi:hypothetical protein